MGSQGEKKRIGGPESSQNKKSVPSNAEFMLKLWTFLKLFSHLQLLVVYFLSFSFHSLENKLVLLFFFLTFTENACFLFLSL